MNMRILFVFTPILLITLITLSYSEQATTFNPVSVSYLKTNLMREGTISPTTGYMYDLQLNLSVPQETHYQSISMDLPENYSLYTAGDNQFLLINANERATSYTYRVAVDVETSSRSISSLNDTYSLGRELAPYTKETSHIKFSDEIRSMARNITRDYRDDIDKIAALAVWVNSYITYDFGEVGKNKDSTLVYTNPVGVCVEYTNLFLALSRSLGYPSRAVLGYTYSPEYGWQMHSWAEVYVGNEWVGVDPTWLEVGYIDATHIPMYFSDDTGFAEYARAYFTERGAELVWEGRGSPGSAAEEIKIIDYREDTLPYEIKIVPEDNFGFGSDGALLLTINSLDYRMFTMRIAPCASDSEIVAFGQKDINVFMHPGMNNVIVPFKVSDSLNTNYNYFCPVVVSHNFGTDIVNVNVSGMKGNAGTFSAVISKFTGKDATVHISSLSNKELFIVEDHSAKSVTTYKGYSYDLSVEKGEAPIHNVLIYNSDYARHIELDFSGQHSSSDKYVLNSLYLAENIPADKNGVFTSSFRITSGEPYTVKIFIDGNQEYFERSLNENYAINYTIRQLPAGRHKFIFIIDFGFEEYRYESFIEVFEPAISIEKFEGTNCTYMFDVSGPYEAYEFYADGNKVNVHSQTRLEAGKHELRVEWIDKAGHVRTYTEAFESECAFSEYMDGLGEKSSAHLCTTAAILISLSVILFYVKSISSR